MKETCQACIHHCSLEPGSESRKKRSWNGLRWYGTIKNGMIQNSRGRNPAVLRLRLVRYSW